MAFDEEEVLQLSELQHFAFCRRQWTLIHIENLWAENECTVEGGFLHGEEGLLLNLSRGVQARAATLGSGGCAAAVHAGDVSGFPTRGHHRR